jgi:tRNA pseudouridine55 synthase
LTVDGFAVVDKEAGWTSHDVVAKARGILGTRKIGHAGTLDPDATGVLLLGVGRATRLLRYATALTKRYSAEVVLGVATSTLDSSGEPTGEWDMGAVTIAEARAAAATLTGGILQVPPMVSAIKVGGKRLHDLARQGIEIEREPRPVTVYRFDVDPTDAPDILRIEVECSAGTYVRTLAADLGTALGGGAHLRNLRRTSVGSFTEDEAQPLEQVTVRPPATALRDHPSVTVTGELVTAIGHGKVLPADVLGVSGDGPWAVLTESGELLAVYEAHRDGTVKPGVVMVG